MDDDVHSVCDVVVDDEMIFGRSQGARRGFDIHFVGGGDVASYIQVGTVTWHRTFSRGR